jgi:hypothetical protein
MLSTWMNTRLPYNACYLDLDIALWVIRTKWGRLNSSVQNGALNIFLGIDGYDNVKKIKDHDYPDYNRQVEDFIRAFGYYLIEADGNVKIYPMMAGNFTHIGSRIYNYDLFTFIIPLNLLFYSNVEAVIASV